MLAGFTGMMNFAREVYGSVMSPVWQLVPRKAIGSSAAEMTRRAS
jgi:nitrogenase molybdenum-cofactor synthesis protein NifE